MGKLRAALGVVILFAAVALAFAWDDKGSEHAGATNKPQLVITPDKLHWGAPPPGTQRGALFALLAGNPLRDGGAFTFRVKLPDGCKIPPHSHPVDENVTVLQGTLLLGKGETFDTKVAQELPAGSFSMMPKGVPHFAQAKGETIYQVNGVGPFDMNYVSPTDDPRKKR
jgi:quercetin dioxygenase-like cupin family protein